jgi:hypothetical protein
MPFPTQFPRDPMQHLVAYLLGGSQRSTRLLIEDCYEILGYGLNVALPGDPDEPLAMMALAPDSPDDCAAIFQEAIAGSQAYQSQPISVPWELILPIVSRLLEQLMRRWAGG